MHVMLVDYDMPTFTQFFDTETNIFLQVPLMFMLFVKAEGGD